MSPEVGTLDRLALSAAMAADPDATLAMLADLLSATDESLRAAARGLAARLVLDRSRVGRTASRGIGRPRQVPAGQGGDLDIDASIDAIAGAASAARAPSLDELVARDWGRPDLALVVVVDHSGSMNGERLAAAAVTAAACALRAPGEHAVLAFAREVQVIKALSSDVAAATVVNEVLRLRGHGVTGLAAALSAAGRQLSGARADRRVVILLSDCRATDEQDPVPAARRLPELLILAPAEDAEEAAAFARVSGGRCAALEGATQAPGLLDRLLR